MLAMTNQEFESTKVFNHFVKAKSSGHLQVVNDSITWILCFSEGKLQYAYHSLQSLKNIKQILIKYKANATAKKIPNADWESFSKEHSLVELIETLKDKNLLTPQEQKVLYKEITLEAIELFFWLKKGQYRWQEDKSVAQTNTDYIWDLKNLLQNLEIRLKAWRQLSALVQSPYQCLSCPNVALFNQEVPNATIAPSILQKLFSVLNNSTIGEFALALKRSELKTLLSLLPYIRKGIIQIKPTKPVFSRLPIIPRAKIDFSSIAIDDSASAPQNLNQNNVTNTLNKITSNSRVGESTPASTSTSNKSKATKKYKIVSIDDSPTMLDLIRNYLGDDKYDVSTLANPMLSLGKMFDVKPDLILLDFSMPGINGNKLCRILRKSHVFTKTPIIMVSGNLNLIEEDKLQSSGITDYLAKPFTRDDLQNIVDKYLM